MAAGRKGEERRRGGGEGEKEEQEGETSAAVLGGGLPRLPYASLEGVVGWCWGQPWRKSWAQLVRK